MVGKRLPAPRAVCVVVLICAVGFWAAGDAWAANRSIDGSGNNLLNPTWGAADQQLLRMAAPDYGDGVSIPSGSGRPNPRAISNAVAAQSSSVLNTRQLTDFVWQWGQFVDHDIDLSTAADPAEPFHISVPTGDPWFDPFSTGTQIIPLTRTVYDPATGTGPGNPRQQINQITAYIDASNIYGSDVARASALRTFSGGQLISSGDKMLMKNTVGMPNANGGPLPDDQMYLSGDVRTNEQIGLTAMHTLFMREHNRLTDELATENPSWDDEQLYQRARKIVGAEMQVITYQEFLPALLGPLAPSLSAAYDPTINPGIANEFSTAIYRLGHSMLSENLLRMESPLVPAPEGPLPLKDAFFNPTLLTSTVDLEHLLMGLSMQTQQDIDNQIVDAVRNFLFGPPGAGGFDLASLNIQRGRDHGLPDYSTVRAAFSVYGLSPVSSFAEVTSDAALQAELAALYGTPDNMDLWVGALAEDHLPGSGVGPLITAALVDQFTRLRDGDRFWYALDSDFTPAEIAELQGTRLSDVILRNTGLSHIRSNVFIIPEPSGALLLLAGAAGLTLLRQNRSWPRG